MNKYKTGQVLKSEERGVPVFNKELSTAIAYINFEDKVIVLEHIIQDDGRNYLKILFDNNRVGFVFNFKHRWEKMS